MSDKNFLNSVAGALELTDTAEEIEEVESAGNSFFDKSYFGTRVLVIVPKPGDEILVAGNMILNFVKAKAEIFIAYNSKKYFVPEVLKELGLSEDKIIFFYDKAELKKIILDLEPNIIFCADCDRKVRYENLSANFEEILGEILREDKNYRPEVYKKFALATALNGPPDFYAPNILSTKRPQVGATDDYDFDIIDKANYSWENRVRFPVPPICQKSLLKGNPLSIAIAKYRNISQEFSGLKILNGDEIFFERRTDNQAYTAKISDAKICDFKILDATDSAEVVFSWSEGVQVQRIIIFGNYLSSETAKIEINLELDNFKANISAEKIFLDNTMHLEGTLPGNGQPLVLDVEKIFVRRAEIKAVEYGKSFGIGEVEFLANVEPLRKIPPFIKFTAQDNFIYKYFVPLEMEKVLLKLYRFHVEGAVNIIAQADGEKFLQRVWQGDDELILNLGGKKEIVLTAEVIGNPNIYDKIIIRRVSDLGQIHHKILQWMDKIAFAVK